MPAANSVICIGSRYWRSSACQRGSVLPAASLLGPNLWARAAASTELRPCCPSTPSECSTWSTVSVCQAGSAAEDGPPNLDVSGAPNVMSSAYRLDRLAAGGRGECEFQASGRNRPSASPRTGYLEPLGS